MRVEAVGEGAEGGDRGGEPYGTLDPPIFFLMLDVVKSKLRLRFAEAGWTCIGGETLELTILRQKPTRKP